MASRLRDVTLSLVDDLVADGQMEFTFEDAMRRLERSPSSTANLLRRMEERGLVDRIRRGVYVIRELGVLGTRAAAESLSRVVGVAFAGHPHRMAYRTALDEHDLVVHPTRTIYVATRFRMRVSSLSGRPLRTVREPEEAVGLGAIPLGNSWVSDRERSLLDAGSRPDLVGGAEVMAQALSAVASQLDIARLQEYASCLHSAAAVRRLGSIADTLEIPGLVGRISPLSDPRSDLDLEPGAKEPRVWRDSRWRMRWSRHPAELRSVIEN